jgi:Zn2+/Cd2+-exporting ATPase
MTTILMTIKKEAHWQLPLSEMASTTHRSLRSAMLELLRGALGSDAAIETANVVIQTDQPSKVHQAIQIGKATNSIVWQNIALAFFVKVVVLGLGAFGVASMWGAVFADVGVALLAILNAVRIQKMVFQE